MASRSPKTWVVYGNKCRMYECGNENMKVDSGEESRAVACKCEVNYNKAVVISGNSIFGSFAHTSLQCGKIEEQRLIRRVFPPTVIRNGLARLSTST